MLFNLDNNQFTEINNEDTNHEFNQDLLKFHDIFHKNGLIFLSTPTIIDFSTEYINNVLK